MYVNSVIFVKRRLYEYHDAEFHLMRSELEYHTNVIYICLRAGESKERFKTRLSKYSLQVVDRLTSHDDHVMFNPNMAVMIDFVNHTECECREKPRLPK